MNNENGETENILDFQYSFGYNCQKFFNLCICDTDTLIWGSGCMITTYDIKKDENTFIRTSTGGNVGCICKNSAFLNLITIGENDINHSLPLIIIYEWPSMIKSKQLKGGSTYTYSHLDYSPDGKILASIGGFPDYNLTIWDWRNECIKLQTKASSDYVNNISFSPFYGHQLITCGKNHIKFWKIADTFTGLKLKDVNGRFGNTDVTDIIGILAMPDETVLSGCSWGNILIWESGEIKLEISRKGRVPCHSAPITQFIRNSQTGEITSIGLDGHICTWHWEKVELLNYTNEKMYVELHPVAERIIPDSKIAYIIKRDFKSWVAQDILNGICILDINIGNETKSNEENINLEPKKLIIAHGSTVVGIIPLNHLPFLISLGSNGSLLIHKLLYGPSRFLFCFSEQTSYLLYMPQNIYKNDIIIIGFCNGTIKTASVNIENFDNDFQSSLIVLQSFKPHMKPVTALQINQTLNILITASEDSTIFVYYINVSNISMELFPMYYIQTPHIIISIAWRPTQDNTILLAGYSGLLIEGILPDTDKPCDYTKINSFKKEFIKYEINYIKKHILYLRTCSSDISDTNIDDLNTNMTLVTDNNIAHKNTILWASYDVEDFTQIWIIQENCNCLIRLQLSTLEANIYIPIIGKLVLCPSAVLPIGKEHIILGLDNGEIIMFHLHDIKHIRSMNNHTYDEFETKLLEREIRNKTKIKDIQISHAHQYNRPPLFRISMHNSIFGKLTSLACSADKRYFYSAGEDGNIFSYVLNYKDLNDTDRVRSNLQILPKHHIISLFKNHEKLDTDTKEFSHEEFVKEREKELLEQKALKHKNEMKNRFHEIKEEYKKLLNDNNKMPINQRIKFEEEFQINQYITQELKNQMELVHRRLAFDLEISNLRLKKIRKRNIDALDFYPFQIFSLIDPRYSVKIMRQKILPKRFIDDFNEIKRKSLSYASLSRDDYFQMPLKSEETIDGEEEEFISKELDLKESKPLLKILPTSKTIPKALERCINKYLERLEKQHSQELEWQQHLAKYNPLISKKYITPEEHPMNEYRLKTQLNLVYSKIPKFQTHLQMFKTRKEIYDTIHEFNDALSFLREQKFLLLEEHSHLYDEYKKIIKILPAHMVKSLSTQILNVSNDEEYVEKNLEIAETKVKDFKSSLPIQNILINYEKHICKCKRCIIDQELMDKITNNALIEQDNILNKMQYSIQNWEQNMKNMMFQREHVLLRTNLLKLHLLKLTREKLILNSYEQQENQLSRNIHILQKKIYNMYGEELILQKEIDAKKENVLSYVKVQQELEKQVDTLISSNRFTAFLKKVYEKKINYSNDIKDSESCKTLSDDESNLSLLSEGNEEHETIFLKAENICNNPAGDTCPPGCDPQIFEEVIKLRSLRYSAELKQKEIEYNIKKLSKVTKSKNRNIKQQLEKLKNYQYDLENIIGEKQNNLNDIESTVILSASQCSTDALNNLHEGNTALVFPETGIENLKERIENLHQEKENQKTKYRTSKDHYKRMQADCDYMNKHINILQENIRKILFHKFGIDVFKDKHKLLNKRVNKILDSVLETMAYTYKLSIANELTEDMKNQYSLWMIKHNKLEKQYCAILKEHTKKLEIATKLKSELFSYTCIEKNYIPKTYKENGYFDDVRKLQQLYKAQKRQIEELRGEVYSLKLKPNCIELPPRSPICLRNVMSSPSISASPLVSTLPPISPTISHPN